MTASKIQFRAAATGPDLSIQVRFDGHQVLSQLLSENPVEVCHEFDDDTLSHCLEIQLTGKTDQHTVLDAQGNIVSDQVIQLDQFRLDDIELDQLVWQHATYQHNQNGHADLSQHGFYGVMGCNGTVTFEFDSPVYLWLLENL